MISVYEAINANWSALNDITSETYPELHRLMERTQIFKRLTGIMDCVSEKYDYAAWPPANPKYFFVSIKEISQWCMTHRGISASPYPWQAAKVLLEDMGLVKIIHVRGTSDDPVLSSIFRKAKEKNFSTCSGWGFPLYSDEVLRNANEVAKIYREKHANLTKLTKTDVIRIRGAERADQLYHGNPLQSNPIEDEVFREFGKILSEAIIHHGYMVANTLESRLYDAFRDVASQDYRYYAAVKKARVQRASLAIELGYKLHPIHREDREAFGISTSYRKWIFTK